MIKITPDLPVAPTAHFLVNEALSPEEALIHASDLLRCAMAAAHECGNGLSGAKRDLAFSVVHLVEMANVMVERSLR